MTDLDLRRAGAIGLIVTAVLTAVTVSFGGLRLFESRWDLTAEFTDGAGLTVGSPVRVAGVRVGEVETIERVPEAGTVRVAMSIGSEVSISQAATVSIRLRSMLGAKYVAISDPAQGPHLADGDLVPLSRTETPVDIDQLLQTLGRSAQPIDTDAINRFVSAFASGLEGHGDELGALIEDIGALAEVLAERSRDLDRLMEASEQLLSAVDSRRDELAGSVEDLAVVFGALEERRADLEGLVKGIRGLDEHLTPLLDENEDALASALGDLRTVVTVLDEQRGRIDLALDQLPVLARRYTDLTDDGPWINVFFVGIVPFPYPSQPVLVGDDGGLPGFWVDDPGVTPDTQIGGTRLEWHDPAGPPPPEDYPG